MRRLFLGGLVLCLGIAPLPGATIHPGAHGNRHKTDYVTSWDAGNTQAYTVSAVASGCSFVDSKTTANGGATLKSHSSSSASAEKSIVHTDKPNTSGFGFSVSGVLAGPGEGGSEVTWSATLQQRFFWLEASPGIVAKAGTAVTVTAKGEPTESTWTVNGTAWKNGGENPVKASSIVLNRNMWDKMGWTPNPVPDDYLSPSAGTYSIAATTTEERNPRSANITVYAVELKDVRVRPSGSPSSTNVVVKTGDKVNISVTASHAYINGKALPFRWSIQQMQSSGSFGDWSAIAAGNDKSSFEYTTASGGIFRVKVELELGEGGRIEEELKRQSDDPHSDLKKGDPDAFGVCDSSAHFAMRSNAAGKLGSTLWAHNVERVHTRPMPDTVWPARGENGNPSGYKCNLFVCEVGDDVGVLIPLINGSTIPRYPPIANQWANTGYSIAGWSIAEKPQPGYIWAKTGSPSGHCGIVDYDGRVISAGPSNVNRNEKRSGTFRKN